MHAYPVPHLLRLYFVYCTTQGFILYRVLMPMINEAFFCMMVRNKGS